MGVGLVQACMNCATSAVSSLIVADSERQNGSVSYTILSCTPNARTCAESLLQGDAPHFVTLNLLCSLLRKHIATANADLVRASMTAPMYGALQSIRAVLEAKTTPSVDESWGVVLGRLVELCQCLSELVSPVVCSSSPEGFLPQGEGGPEVTVGVHSSLEVDRAVSAEIQTSSMGNAQSLLLCCWHTMKEVSLLLGHLVENSNVAVGAGAAKQLFTHQQVTSCGLAGFASHCGFRCRWTSLLAFSFTS